MKKTFCLLALCVMTASTGLAEPIKVASLNTVLTDIARNVGGDRVDVIEIVKAGTDPHAFEPTPGDIKKIASAKLVLASGLGFESYLDKLKSSVGAGPTFVVAGDAIKPLMGFEEGCGEDHDHAGHGHADPKDTPDPHWFHSIKNAKLVTTQIRDAFIKAYPPDASVFEANAKAFQTKLDELARWAKIEIAKVPRAQRILVTSHDALGYFARDYSFKVLPVQGINTGEQPSSKKVSALIEEIRTTGVKAIFAENIENPKVLQQITAETGAKIGGVLYADGLGTGNAGTYGGMVRTNVTTIVNALQ